MTTYRLQFTLLDDVVFSQRNATAGDHACRDLVPGMALWGWAAAWMYRHHPQLADALVQSGRVRFSDARPIAASGSATCPIPLSWVYDKGSTVGHVQDGLIHAPAVLNLAAPDVDLGQFAQAKGMRDGYVSAMGEWVRPMMNYRLKTAINAYTGSAKDAQLFGYASLMAGQRFEGKMSIQPEDHCPAVVELLEQLQIRPLRLGRSKSGEFGRVRCTVEPRSEPTLRSPTPSETLTLWLLSDTQLRDEHGRPTLIPDPKAVGLAGAVFDPSRSAIRHRSYSVWNSHRNAYGVERQCLVAGSVLVFHRLGHAFTEAELDGFRSGIGVDTAQGLGEVAVNPDLLREASPRFEPRPPVAGLAPAPPIPAPSTPLARYLQAKARTETTSVDAGAYCRSNLPAIHDLLRSGRRYLGVQDALAFGPGASQWGRLAQELAMCESQENFDVRIRQGVLKPDNNADWNVCADSDPRNSLARLLLMAFESILGQGSGTQWKASIRACVHLCHEARNREVWLNRKMSGEVV